jgi:ferredoxin
MRHADVADRRAPTLRVELDADACAGHGVCVGLAPDVFELVDDGYSVTKVSEVPPELEDAVRAAVRQCPTHAITISS